MKGSFTRVIRSFQTNKESVSYMGFRDSKFTRLLQPCFNGSTHTSFLVCMTPASSYIVILFYLISNLLA